MPAPSTLEVTIALTDPQLDEEEKDEEVQKLLAQLRDLDEVESSNRVVDPNPPAGNKAIGGFIVGLLMAEVNTENLKKLFGFLGDRLGNKPISLKVKAPDGRELELQASSQEEFDFAYQRAQDFLRGA